MINFKNLACHFLNILNDIFYDFINGREFIYLRPCFKNKSGLKYYASHPTHISILNKITNEISKTHTPKYILDVGCGHGRVVNFFAKKFKCSVDGIEIISEMFLIAKSYNKYQSNVLVKNDNALNMDKNIKYDLIFMFNPFSKDIFIEFMDGVIISKDLHVIMLNCNYIQDVKEFLATQLKYFKLHQINYCGKNVNYVHFILNGEGNDV